MRQRPLQHSKRIGAAGWDGGFSTLHDTKSVFLTFSTPVCVGHQAGGLPGTAGRSGRFGPGTRGTFAAARCHLEENVVFSVHVEMNGDSFTPKSPNNLIPIDSLLFDLFGPTILKTRCLRATSGLVGPCRQRVWETTGECLRLQAVQHGPAWSGMVQLDEFCHEV